MEIKENHLREAPIAQLSAITLNLNRDSKKKAKPYHYKELCFYKNPDDRELPSSYYGSAAVQLVKLGKMPNWALFCFPKLKEAASESYIPDTCAFIDENAIFLHPIKEGNGYKGMLIAREAASDKKIVMTSEKGEQIELSIPTIKTKVIAQESITLYP